MGIRGAEICWFLSKLFPVQQLPDDEKEITEFIDVAKTLGVMVGGRTPTALKQQHSLNAYLGPWKEEICTLTSVTRIVFRRAWKTPVAGGRGHKCVGEELHIKMRMLTGAEAMNVIGFGPECYIKPCTAQQKTLWSLAGNVMSAFVLVPNWCAAIATLGGRTQREQVPVEVEVTDSSASGSSERSHTSHSSHAAHAGPCTAMLLVRRPWFLRILDMIHSLQESNSPQSA